jgi:hypothetical protein
MFAGTISIISFNIIGGIFIFSKNRRKKNEELEAEENYKSSLLCRFVMDGAGRKVGESVAIDDDLLIIKSGIKYLGIPLKHIEEEEKTLLVKGLVERDKAELLGEKWRQQSFCEIKYDDGEKNGF